jgi:hypothetical protein
MRIFIGDNTCKGDPWFYSEHTKTIYHTCKKMDHSKSIVYEYSGSFKCALCSEKVPDFVLLASCISVST